MFRVILRMPFYSVARGRQVGVFQTWSECESQVKGFSGAAYKKFNTLQEAESFATGNSGSRSTASTLDTVSYATKRPASSSSATAYPVYAAKKAKLTLDTKQYTTNITKMASYGDYDFTVDDNGFVHVYTDGSCENNGRGNASAGLGVYFGEGHPLNQAAPVSGRATNNCGEIQAATKAIELSAQCNIKKVCINTDSQFLINSATKWMDAWRARGWTLKSGGRVKNEHDFRDLNRVLTNHPDVQVKWSYVPAHSGIMGNERADTLAKEGAGMYKADKSQ